MQQDGVAGLHVLFGEDAILVKVDLESVGNLVETRPRAIHAVVAVLDERKCRHCRIDGIIDFEKILVDRCLLGDETLAIVKRVIVLLDGLDERVILENEVIE